MIEEHLTCEISESLVILFDYTSTCHYAQDSEGNIYPNGTYCPPNDYHWNDATDRRQNHAIHPSTKDFNVGFKARIYLKKEYKRSESVRAEYLRADTKLLGEYGEKLNDFVGVSIKETHEEMPYTEELAAKFYSAMMGLCHLADQIQSFFENPDNILNSPDILALPKGN